MDIVPSGPRGAENWMICPEVLFIQLLLLCSSKHKEHD